MKQRQSSKKLKQDWWKGEYFEYNREADDFLNKEGVSVTDKYGNVEELGWIVIEDDNAWMYIEIPKNS